MVFYFVQRGETLYHIAKRYQTTVHAIVAANRLQDPNAICPGQALIIPRPGEVPSPPPGGIVHLVRPGETVFHLAQRFGAPVQEILRANQIAHPEFILPGQQLVIPERPGAGEEWPMQGRTPGRGGASPAALPAAVPQPSWACIPRRGAAPPSPPVIRYDRIYAGLGDGAYYCLEKGSGRVKWRLPAGEPADSLPAPAVFDGLVYLGTPTGTALAVDAYRGTLIWKTLLGAPVVAAPAVADGLVYLSTGDGRLHALEAKTGAWVWRCDLPAAPALAVGDGCVYAAGGGQVWAVDGQSGEVRWRRSLPQGPEAPPVFGELVVLVGGWALDPRDGQDLWAVPEEVAPVVRGDAVLYPGGGVDLFSGEYRWRWGGPARPVAAASNGVLALAPEGDLVALAPAGEGELWRLAVGTAICHAALAPGLLALTLADGSLRAVKFTTGRARAGARERERD